MIDIIFYNHQSQTTVRYCCYYYCSGIFSTSQINQIPLTGTFAMSPLMSIFKRNFRISKQ